MSQAARNAWCVMKPAAGLSNGCGPIGSGRNTGSRVLSRTTREKKGARSLDRVGVGAA
jgi:hypothetical protein